MIENIKVDIVYFMTATDFEFEFNLGGCCHMRLLNDKVNDKKSFVNSLARAVSRSQIILSVGPLFGEDGLISLTAAAINCGLSTIDNKAYGIVSDDKIEIIEGAVPLVTREGYFGGCIIESGEQSIVVLTENRTIRKSIMKTLVHPYIEDMCIMKSAERGGHSIKSDLKAPEIEQPANESLPAEPAIETVDAVPEAAEPEEITMPEKEKREDDDSIPEKPQETALPYEADDGEHNMEIVFSNDGEVYAAGSQEETDEEADDASDDGYFISETDDGDSKDTAGRSRGINISILVITAILLIVVLALCYFLIFLPMVGGMSTAEYFKQIFNTASNVSSV